MLQKALLVSIEHIFLYCGVLQCGAGGGWRRSVEPIV